MLAGAGVLPWERPIAAAEDYVLVVHSSVGKLELEVARARRFLAAMEAEWPNGAPVVIVLPPRGSGAIKWVTVTILQMPEPAYRRHLLSQVFRGLARKPIEAESMADLREQVLNRRGAISALPRSLVTDGMRIVSIR